MGFFFSLLKTSIRSTLSLRLAFFIESILMIGNNLIFLLIWWLFFREFKSVGGWDFDDMIALTTVVSGAYGLSLICFGGVKELSKTIVSGGLDSFMTQPKNLLLHLIGSKSRSKGWGHIMTSIILFILGGKMVLANIPLLLIFILGGCLVFTAFGVIVHSMPFFFGRVESVAKTYSDSLIVFVQYPVNIYTGFIQFVMYTIFPAAIIGFLPVELLRVFNWFNFFIFLGGVSLFILAAFTLFYLGLRRYESGNQFGLRL